MTTRRGFFGKVFGAAVGGILSKHAKVELPKEALPVQVSWPAGSLKGLHDHGTVLTPIHQPQNIGQIIESGGFPTNAPRANFLIGSIHDEDLIDWYELSEDRAHHHALIEDAKRDQLRYRNYYPVDAENQED